MLPEANMNRPEFQNAPPALYNQVSSLGAAPEVPAEKPVDAAVSPAEKLINSFGAIAADLKNLSSEYPHASVEYGEVIKALKNWLAKASDGISSENGGEPTTY